MVNINQDVPKILIISSVIPQNKRAGNILLYRLLKNYPSKNILVIGNEVTKWEKEDLLENVEYKKLTVKTFQFGFTRFAKWFRTIQLFLTFGNTSKRISQMAMNFRPDIILSVMESYSYYYPAYKYAKKNNIPLSLIIHDQPEEFEPVFTYFKKIQIKKNAIVYKYAKSRLNISKQMEFFLREHYGASGEILYPLPSEIIHRDLEDNLRLRTENCLTIGYAGTPAYGYAFQLEEMLPVLEKLNGRIYFYGVSLPSNLQNYSNVSYRGFNSPELTWTKIKDECDAVVLPYTWKSGTYESLYRTHFPSKLPEYLSLGMPVIVIGPSYATGVIWAIENKESVLVISERNTDIWYKEFSRLKEEHSFRLKLSENSLCGKDNYFGPHKIQEEFIESINKAINRKIK